MKTINVLPTATLPGILANLTEDHPAVIEFKALLAIADKMPEYRALSVLHCLHMEGAVKITPEEVEFTNHNYQLARINRNDGSFDFHVGQLKQFTKPAP